MAYEKLKTESYVASGGINSKVSPYNNAENESRDIINMNFATPGALTKRPGTTLFTGATVTGRITGIYEFERLNGSSYVIATANTNAYTVNSSNFSVFKSSLLNSALFDFTTLTDRMFAGNGQDFFKFNGVTSYAYSLPNGASGWGVTAVIGGGLSGLYVASWGYINERGYFGPATNGITISLNGSTFGSIGYVGLTALGGYGITALQLYRSIAGGIDTFGTTTVISTGVTAVDTGFPLTNLTSNDNLFFTLAPKYLEIYNNQLFMAGFSGYQSTAFWSEVGEPEAVDPTFFAEFRTNDGDRITALKSYQGSLLVFKNKSFHRITGDNPSNFALQEITDQYGCVSNRAVVTFEDVCWFLDPKGIVEYNGANVSVVSNKVESVFKDMNLSAALENAVAIHNRESNEVWFAIPCNGADYNNCIIVYDYLTKAWTRYEGVNVSSIMLGKGALSERAVIVGSYTGSISNFGDSYYSDLGAAITCTIRTAYLAKLGQTSEAQYRRFYLNLDSITGITQPININLYCNYGASLSVSRTMYQNPFQSRIDFGIPARSIQAEIIHSSASLPLRVYGYAFESRFQRNT